MTKVAIVGGGAAGFFLAVNLKEMAPAADVTIFERSSRVLAKVEVSGGGRCNCTNTFDGVGDLSQVYPRGHRLMKRLFNVFDHRDAFAWFERHGVPLTVQPDQCVFPLAQDSHAVVDCFLRLARQYGIAIRTHARVQSMDDVGGYDYVAVTTGGSPTGAGLRWLEALGHATVTPVPSLFSLAVDDSRLHSLQGLVAANAAVHIPATKLRAEGPLLITHWGMSGPAVLRLSSHAARLLADHGYRLPVGVNWTGRSEADVQAALSTMAGEQPRKMLVTRCPVGLQQRLWAYVLERALGPRAQIRWSELNRKDANRLTNTLVNDTYLTAGRAPFSDEFVTCGGIALSSVSATTLESRHADRLYFAGEVLDVDGVTGGFNFQAAWTTAYTVARSIAARINGSDMQR